MKKIQAILLFHRKLVIPSLAISTVTGLISFYIRDQLVFTSFGLPYLFLPSLMHYFIYEIRYSNEYYFYYNLGLSKIALWVSTLILSLFGAIIISILSWIIYRLTV